MHPEGGGGQVGDGRSADERGRKGSLILQTPSRGVHWTLGPDQICSAINGVRWEIQGDATFAAFKRSST